ncbi:LuxR C-terminal-related transcriptional regulator [Virgibacillus sp. JSM 102003]|uniref:LuxR C-terminal-related transcriptional regulator n=1 Tax=Virgibacillus sp. JSM 102003 TaxID=1562108 RepID=UPI0035C26AEF
MSFLRLGDYMSFDKNFFLHVPTKMIGPYQNHHILPRERISEYMDRSVKGKATLITAPAGYGKTTAIVQWLNSRKLLSVWTSFDKPVDNPTEFLQIVMASIQANFPEIKDGSFQTVNLDLNSIEAVLEPLISTLSLLKSPVVLVFDDYHNIEHPWIHAAVEYLITNVPVHIHLVLSSREKTPFSLHYLRLDRQVCELDMNGIRLNYEEFQDYCSLLDLQLSLDEVNLLEKRTEGWITGVNLAYLSKNCPLSVKHLDGTYKFISEYFVKQVLDKLPDSLQIFVLRASVLDDFTTPLCAAVTGFDNAENLIQELWNRNIFIDVLDNEKWFRFHPLFQEAMQYFLQRNHGESIKSLYKKATEWTGQHGFHQKATEYALRGEHFNLAIKWLLRCAPNLLRKRELLFLNKWINRFPLEFREENCDLLLIHAWIHALSEDLDGADKKLAEALVLMEQTDSKTIDQYAEILAIQGYMAIIRHEPQKAFHSLTKAANKMLTVSRYLQAGVDFNGVEAFVIRGPLGASGKLKSTHELYTNLRNLLRQRGLAVVAYGSIILAEIHYEWCEWDQVRYFINRGKEISVKNQMIGVLVPVYFLQAKYNISKGETGAAWNVILNLENQLKQMDPPQHWFAVTEAFKTRLYIKERKIDEVDDWLNNVSAVYRSDPFPESPLNAFQNITKVRALIMKGKYESAKTLLNNQKNYVEMKVRIGDLIEVFILESIIHYLQNNLQKSVISMEQAINLAEPELYLRIFLDEGKVTATILNEIHQSNPTTYTKKLLTLYEQEEIYHTPESQELPEQSLLTKREMELLQLVKSGMKNKEIAGKLYISLGSVKVYLTQIYNKLDVNNRTKAVEKARELNILE